MDRRQAAAANNAEWCDLVARSHGLRTRFDQEAWTSWRRTPPLYPDAVTLIPSPSVRDLLSRIDTSPGCSVKDSFGVLDLAPHGFRVLFEADWIARPPAAPAAAPGQPRWRRVRRPGSLARWEDAWRNGTGPSGLFKADLLGDDSVAVLAAEHGGQVVAGAVLNCSPEVVGISNFFTRADAGTEAWPGCLAFACSLFPGRTLVGYESGGGLVQAETSGFASIGRLRVWVNDTGRG